MSEVKTEALQPQFRILSVEKTTPPGEVSGGEWYCYTIANRLSPITGYRSGSLKSVTEYLEEYVENLNARAAVGASTYGKRNTKK